MPSHSKDSAGTADRPTSRRIPLLLILSACMVLLTLALLWTIGLIGPATWGESSSVAGPDFTRGGVNAGENGRVAGPPHDLVSDAKPELGGEDSFPPPYPEWPANLVVGEPAKQLLLDTLTRLDESFRKIPAYTATFRKQERIKGKLLGEQTFSLKVRQDPFAVYLKAVTPASGKEVIFARGHFEDKVIAHSAGLSRLLVPRLQVPPDHPLIRSESRHPITNAGIGNLIKNLIGYRMRDLGQPEAETTLDRWTDPDGQLWLRSVHVHHEQTADRPFKRVEVLYHPETRLPLRFTGYDWPDSNSESGTAPSPILGEHYCYDDLTLNAPLSPIDFDPTNPAYQFHRF